MLGPVFSQNRESLLGRVVSLAYPASDIVLVSLVVILWTRPGTRQRTSLGLVLAGILALALADSAFAYFSAVHNYEVVALDSGWVLGYLLIALGALWASGHPDHGPRAPSDATFWTVLGPYFPATLAAVVFVWRISTHEPLRATSQLAAFGLVLVLSARQVLVLFDNLALTRRLAISVEERSAALHHQAFHDGLTDLPNRALFNRLLANAIQRRTRSGAALAVLFIDLDHFKRVNDLHGHDVGDRLLQDVGAHPAHPAERRHHRQAGRRRVCRASRGPAAGF